MTFRITEDQEVMRWFEPGMRVHQCGADYRNQRLQPVHFGQVTFALAPCSLSQWPLDVRQREFDSRQ